LLKVDMPVISTLQATSLLEGVVGANVWDFELCLFDIAETKTLGGLAMGSGICVPENGHTVVAGLYSWGVATSVGSTCMLASFPAVGTRVSSYLPWIGTHNGGGGGPLLAPPYVNLGNGTPGTGGKTPMLVGWGYQTPGSDIHIDLSNAPAGAMSKLFIGGSLFNAPFKGGVLVPGAPYFDLGLLPVGGDGTLSLLFPWPSGVPAGVNVYLQQWMVDAGGPKGFAASNGLKILAL
jgi:hypothetical protein